jgi:glucose 1-dehydrogenase
MDQKDRMNLEGGVAIISGGLGDIGQAIARELAGLGADVAVGDVRSDAAAAPLLGTLGAIGRRGRYDYVDVADAAAVAAWVEQVEEELGVADLVIPNAAIVTLKGIRDVTPAEWQHELSINLSGGFHLAQAAAKRLVHHGRPGRIVFVGSWAAHAAHPTLPTYCVAKAGLRVLMQCLALDLAPHGILVNEVAPGYVDAGLSGRIFTENPDVRARAASQVPNGRLITAEEVAAQVAHPLRPRQSSHDGQHAPDGRRPVACHPSEYTPCLTPLTPTHTPASPVTSASRGKTSRRPSASTTATGARRYTTWRRASTAR